MINIFVSHRNVLFWHYFIHLSIFLLDYLSRDHTNSSLAQIEKKQCALEGRCVKRHECQEHKDCKQFSPHDYCKKGSCYKPGCQNDNDCVFGDFCIFTKGVYGTCSGAVIQGKTQIYLLSIIYAFRFKLKGCLYCNFV